MMNKKVILPILLLFTSFFVGVDLIPKKAIAEPSDVRWLTVPIAELSFDPQDASIERGYNGLTLASSGNGTLAYTTALAQSGAALNISSDSASTAYFDWRAR